MPENTRGYTPAELSHESREKVLDLAKNAVLKDRNATHGNPEDNFKTIADYMNTYCASRGMQVNFKPHDVAAIMVLMKISRTVSSTDKIDHWTDIAGYAACGAGCVAVANGQPLRD